MRTWAIVLAAGQGSRLAGASGGTRKQFLPYRGKPLFWESIRLFSSVAGIDGIVLAVPPIMLEEAQALVRTCLADFTPPLPLKVVGGGERRQDSVQNALSALPAEAYHVLVHDAARPFASPSLVARLLDRLRQGARAVIPALPMTDTVKRVIDNQVLDTPDRASLRRIQTPQGFVLTDLLKGFEVTEAQRLAVTDDASLVETLGVAIELVDGEEGNVKITNPEDLALISKHAPQALVPRVAMGYDVHAYGNPAAPTDKDRPMRLGGVDIPGGPVVLAHSDGDVVYHAVADALLSLCGAGDIGKLFPDSDPALARMESAVIVSESLRRVREAGLTPVHLDVTIVAQVPKIGPHRDRMRDNLAALLDLSPGSVNVKATTEEHLGFTGEKRGIKTYAVVTAVSPQEQRPCTSRT